MRETTRSRNTLVRWGLAVILLVDLGLVAVNWQLKHSPHVEASDLKRLDMLERSYRADNTRLERFRNELPVDEKQWDQFFTMHFPPAGSGYSAISEDLGQLSTTAGLRSDTITFHQLSPDARGLVEIDIATSVEGDYDNLLKFLDKLEHSDNFYVLDSLALANSSVGKLRLNLQLRTYFRTT